MHLIVLAGCSEFGMLRRRAVVERNETCHSVEGWPQPEDNHKWVYTGSRFRVYGNAIATLVKAKEEIIALK